MKISQMYVPADNNSNLTKKANKIYSIHKYGFWFYRMNKQTENTITTNILHKYHLEELPAEGRLNAQN
jgi:hypothetical protein